jgi:hypothetical protein
MTNDQVTTRELQAAVAALRRIEAFAFHNRDARGHDLLKATEDMKAIARTTLADIDNARFASETLVPFSALDGAKMWHTACEVFQHINANVGPIDIVINEAGDLVNVELCVVESGTVCYVMTGKTGVHRMAKNATTFDRFFEHLHGFIGNNRNFIAKGC